MNFIGLNSNWKFEWNKSVGKKIALFIWLPLQAFSPPGQEVAWPTWRFWPVNRSRGGFHPFTGAAPPADGESTRKVVVKGKPAR
jgi:hypothetical protein